MKLKTYPRYNLATFIDGDHVVVVHPNFVDLATSPALFYDVESDTGKKILDGIDTMSFMLVTLLQMMLSGEKITKEATP